MTYLLKFKEINGVSHEYDIVSESERDMGSLIDEARKAISQSKLIGEHRLKFAGILTIENV